MSFPIPEGPIPEGAGPRPEVAQPARGGAKPPGWIAPIGLALAVVAVALAAWSLLRPAPEPASSDSAPSAEQQASAKTGTCKAFAMVSKAVALQTHADLGPDPVAKETVAANARLAMFGGGSYLLAHIDPATPDDLAAAAKSFANGLQDIAVYALAGVPNIEATQAARLRDAESASNRVAQQCK